jgi:predicted lipid-binding transport protein (Tim44 family)
MPQIVYGTFSNEAEADLALDRLHELQVVEHPGEAYNAIVHTGHVREEDVQLGGTLGLVGGVIGGLVVGIVGGLIAEFMIWPIAGVDFGIAGMFLMMIAGSVFGVVAGAVAGASECKSSIKADAARMEKNGGSIVVCETDDPFEVPKIIHALGEETAHAA